MQEKLDRIGYAFGAGLWNVYPVASVVFSSITNVPAVYTMRCPGAAIGWGFKHEHSGYWGGKGHSIKVEDSIELRFCQQLRVNPQRAEEVRCQRGLRQ